ncbi:MAG: hypothetical protein EOO28_00230 [Comamonadaceae bacterium]|nr:MAG: hypothetical protein EOO28_00230 [Comamonadaceae bacterium]
MPPLSPSPAGSALLGEGVVLIWNDVTAEGRSDFYQWHDHEHIPERLSINGFLRGRRYVCPGHSPEWLTVYEANNLDVLVSPDYLARLNAPTPATSHTLQFFRNTSRAVCRIAHTMGGSSAGHALTIRLDAPAAQAADLTRHLAHDLFPQAMSVTGVVACHLFTADQSASFLNTAESSTRAFDVPSWVVVIEATLPDAARQARSLIEQSRLREMGAVLRSDAAVYTLEISRLSQAACASPRRSNHA